ncbi:MAG: TIGR03905 family TSCPD domain-containing protein [Mycoplasmoidaceae bacterium]|nr:MAG: TIGR03905 family TSCPD domain-containing protein [Mycoplasmoidaceae bacterium]
MKYEYKPTGVCAQKFIFDIDDKGMILSLETIGGCNGNLKGIAKLVKGQKAKDIISKLKGVDCNGKGTSCPDQIAKALDKYLKLSK